MVNFKNKTVILWDFDGVILDSMEVRTKGFKTVLGSFPEKKVQELVNFHLKNGGLSRYVKFKYFFEQIIKVPVNSNDVEKYSNMFSEIMLEILPNKKLLIPDSLNFIIDNQEKFEMHIVSGSDENELKKLCYALDITNLFKSIQGSPVPKTDLVSEILAREHYYNSSVVLIGDSINDHDAAIQNSIDFLGYNNTLLLKKGLPYIKSFNEIV
ncbi:HAD hydrolase-like protein [Gillisia sp. M10.2A]|uniref:phosphoglycolate phosphatase n=1 Tax=Gillisia lutea TaxID=2909668 RepID=A0ABS9ELK0_9FLAO|nr:HAD hydrolase-like protein [Gillisia lutea]MCF4102675.1 HAD hydrolase-like protein [Gillisia lutea]